MSGKYLKLHYWCFFVDPANSSQECPVAYFDTAGRKLCGRINVGILSYRVPWWLDFRFWKMTGRMPVLLKMVHPVGHRQSRQASRVQRGTPIMPLDSWWLVFLPLAFESESGPGFGNHSGCLWTEALRQREQLGWSPEVEDRRRQKVEEKTRGYRVMFESRCDPFADDSRSASSLIECSYVHRKASGPIFTVRPLLLSNPPVSSERQDVRRW